MTFWKCKCGAYMIADWKTCADTLQEHKMVCKCYTEQERSEIIKLKHLQEAINAKDS